MEQDNRLMKVGKKGLLEIASHEALVTGPYRDSVGVWTIGIGHTANAGKPDPTSLGQISVKEGFKIFANDIKKFERRVNNAFTRPLKQHQFDAAVSFDFNTGGIHRATWVRLFNEGKDQEAERAFMNWSSPPEIVPRRKKERNLFFDGKYTSNGIINVYPAINGQVQWSKGKRVRYDPKPTEPFVVPKPKVPEPETKTSIFEAIFSALKVIVGLISNAFSK